MLLLLSDVSAVPCALVFQYPQSEWSFESGTTLVEDFRQASAFWLQPEIAFTYYGRPKCIFE